MSDKTSSCMFLPPKNLFIHFLAFPMKYNFSPHKKIQFNTFQLHLKQNIGQYLTFNDYE